MLIIVVTIIITAGMHFTMMTMMKLFVMVLAASPAACPRVCHCLPLPRA